MRPPRSTPHWRPPTTLPASTSRSPMRSSPIPMATLPTTWRLAFYIGQSAVVGGIKTDMVAYASHGVFVQMWIGAQDKLPRRARAIFRNDPQRLRHQVDFSNWKLDGDVPAGTFASARAAGAERMHLRPPESRPRRTRPMKKIIVSGLVSLLVATLSCAPAVAWSHSGAYGSASGGGGSRSASNDYGGARRTLAERAPLRPPPRAPPRRTTRGPGPRAGTTNTVAPPPTPTGGVRPPLISTATPPSTPRYLVPRP